MKISFEKFQETYDGVISTYVVAKNGRHLASFSREGYTSRQVSYENIVEGTKSSSLVSRSMVENRGRAREWKNETGNERERDKDGRWYVRTRNACSRARRAANRRIGETRETKRLDSKVTFQR